MNKYFKSNSIFVYTQETDRPTVFDIPDKKGPAASNAASGKRSNAIKIVKVIMQIKTYLELRDINVLYAEHLYYRHFIIFIQPPSDYKEPEEPRGNRGNQQNGKKGKTFNDLFSI